MSSVLVVGTIALDSIKTPFGDKKEILGGSGVYAAVAASFFAGTELIGPIGADFPPEHLKFLASRKIGTAALQKIDGPTFRWGGYYEYDMNQAHTVDTQLNVLTQFDPVIPENLRGTEFVFLANIDPELQLKVLDQLKKPKLLVADTMNFWIESKREALHKVIKRVDYMVMNDGEIVQIGTPIELFEVPQHTFVGYFIGSPGMNIIPCEVKGGEATVAGHPVATRNAALWRGNGKMLELGVRPEFVSFAETGIPVDIVKVADAGRYRIVDTRHAGMTIKMLMREGAAVPTGSSSIRFDREHSNVYEDGWIVS